MPSNAPIPEDLRFEYEALTTRKILLSNGTIVALIERIAALEQQLAAYKSALEYCKVSNAPLANIWQQMIEHPALAPPAGEHE